MDPPQPQGMDADLLSGLADLAEFYAWLTRVGVEASQASVMVDLLSAPVQVQAVRLGRRRQAFGPPVHVPKSATVSAVQAWLEKQQGGKFRVLCPKTGKELDAATPVGRLANAVGRVTLLVAML